MTLSSMIQPLAQFGPIRPGWSAVGGAQGLEVGPNGGLLITDFGVPDKSRLLGIPDPIDCSGPVIDHLRTQRWVRHLWKGQHLIETGSVEVDVAQVLFRRGLVGVNDPI